MHIMHCSDLILEHFIIAISRISGMSAYRQPSIRMEWIEENQKLIDRMPKIMEAIIEAKEEEDKILNFDKNPRKLSVV